MPTTVFMCDSCQKIHMTADAAKRCEDKDEMLLRRFAALKAPKEKQEQTLQKQVERGGNPYIPDEKTIEELTKEMVSGGQVKRDETPARKKSAKDLPKTGT